MAVAGTGQSTGVYAQPDNISLTSKQCGNLTRRVLLPSMVYGEVKAGQQLGELEYLLDGKVVRTLPLLADSDIEAAVLILYRSCSDISGYMFDGYRRIAVGTGFRLLFSVVCQSGTGMKIIYRLQRLCADFRTLS